jgi:hypothetical protein
MSRNDVWLWQLLKDMKHGCGDTTLRGKYYLSEQALQALSTRLLACGLLKREGNRQFIPEKRTISAREIVGDIRSGLTDTELMSKHLISRAKLNKICSKLVETGALTRRVLSERRSAFKDSVTIDFRFFQRALPIFSTAVYDRENPANTGRIRDISERGVGARDLAAELNEVKSLVVLPNALLELNAFAFQARCRWTKRLEDGARYSGFEIISASVSDLNKLNNLIQFMVVFP